MSFMCDEQLGELERGSVWSAGGHICRQNRLMGVGAHDGFLDERDNLPDNLIISTQYLDFNINIMFLL